LEQVDIITQARRNQKHGAQTVGGQKHTGRRGKHTQASNDSITQASNDKDSHKNQQ